MASGTGEGEAARGPLILGSGGRVGRMFRALAAQGLWPGPEPVWHTRDGQDRTLGWDLALERPPDRSALDGVSGIVALAGATRAIDGTEAVLAWANESSASAARRLGRDLGLTVLLCSSAAVYGPGPAQPGGHCEDDEPHPTSAYGRAKREVEMQSAVDLEVLGGLTACALRIGNVAGADALFGAAARGPVTLDRFADGQGPRRAYVGPLTLARAMVALLARDDLPRVLNLAQPGPVAMADVLAAAGLPWDWRAAPPEALPALALDTRRAEALVRLPPATPEGLVAEARLAGWRPWGEA